ncbi:hypothetical protein ILUMI_18802 [Ignelater luminosus]|uniref:Uncharacterized protein n=1 Tax=Ignelater luminosus TaxID=2038154 RepID=A0A8K0G672_IGNLU|nr:hypothetical protein ILUMI_18802 [Ignelater luminosus]
MEITTRIQDVRKLTPKKALIEMEIFEEVLKNKCKLKSLRGQPILIDSDMTKTDRDIQAYTREEVGDNRGKKLKTWQMGVCNVQGLNGNKEELIREFEEAKIKILGITETKEKEDKSMIMGNGK